RRSFLVTGTGVGCRYAGVAAGNEYPAILAFKTYSVGILAADMHGDVIGIFCGHLEISVHVPKPLVRELSGRFYFQRTAVFCSHSPVGDVNVMDSPAGDHACAELLTTQPTGPGKNVGRRMYPILGIVTQGRSPQPDPEL